MIETVTRGENKKYGNSQNLNCRARRPETTKRPKPNAELVQLQTQPTQMEGKTRQLGGRAHQIEGKPRQFVRFNLNKPIRAQQTWENLNNNLK